MHTYIQHVHSFELVRPREGQDLKRSKEQWSADVKCGNTLLGKQHMGCTIDLSVNPRNCMVISSGKRHLPVYLKVSVRFTGAKEQNDRNKWRKLLGLKVWIFYFLLGKHKFQGKYSKRRLIYYQRSEKRNKYFKIIKTALL